MTNARDLMHEEFCPRNLRCAHNKYRLDRPVPEKCVLLDALLDQVEDDCLKRFPTKEG